jgi:pimeloyl-ACP methyl ester carboxylesterase
MLALVTQAGVLFLQRAYPAQGKMIEVTGATLHVVDIGPRDAAGPPIVMIHGASSNLEVMRRPLGDMLARRHRVILIDRPGHGWSTRARNEDSTPAIQGRMIDEALGKLGVDRAIFVVHSWAGALGARMALDYPACRRAHHAGAGGVSVARRRRTIQQDHDHAGDRSAAGLYDHAAARLFPGRARARGVFLPQTMPDGFVQTSATPLLLRPREFIANAYDLVTLKEAVREQAARYADIKVPAVVISGDSSDKTVSTSIHSRPFATAVPHAKLIVLPNVGHMVPNTEPELVIREIEAMLGSIARSTAAAEN